MRPGMEKRKGVAPERRCRGRRRPRREKRQREARIRFRRKWTGSGRCNRSPEADSWLLRALASTIRTSSHRTRTGPTIAFAGDGQPRQKADRQGERPCPRKVRDKPEWRV